MEIWWWLTTLVCLLTGNNGKPSKLSKYLQSQLNSKLPGKVKMTDISTSLAYFNVVNANYKLTEASIVGVKKLSAVKINKSTETEVIFHVECPKLGVHGNTEWEYRSEVTRGTWTSTSSDNSITITLTLSGDSRVTQTEVTFDRLAGLADCIKCYPLYPFLNAEAGGSLFNENLDNEIKRKLTSEFKEALDGLSLKGRIQVFNAE